MTKVCIIGVGFVGEHLLSVFKNHYSVTGVDVSSKRVMYLKYKYPDVSFQVNFDGIEEMDVFLVSVPTLVKDKTKELDLSSLYNVRDTLLQKAKQGSMIVVESSVYVGATREIFGELRERGVLVGFSPERVDPGRTEPAMQDIPKVVSGIDEESLNKMKQVYSQVFTQIVPVSSPECAEMCKLYENCYRMVNIAYVNEIGDMCDSLNIDKYEMINAAASKPFGFMPFYPGAGVGGHCIPVNPYYLMQNGYNLPVLKYATELMEARPKEIAKDIAKKAKNNNNRGVLVIGIGFKKGESLTTNSPGFEIYKELRKSLDRVQVYDPLVEEAYCQKDIQFVKEKDFNPSQLKDMFGTIVMTLSVDDFTKQVLSEYKTLGGQVIQLVK